MLNFMWLLSKKELRFFFFCVFGHLNIWTILSDSKSLLFIMRKFV